MVVVDSWSSPTLVSDVNQWSQNHGVPQLKAGQYTDASPPGLSQAPEGPSAASQFVDPAGWSVEETLDVEAIHGIAPGANIVYQGAPSPFNESFDAAELAAVSQDKGNEVSNSWGGSCCGSTADNDIYDQIMSMAASTGVGVYFSSGDTSTAEWPSARPDVTAVGGTSSEVASTGQLGFETGWQTGKWTLANGSWTAAGVVYGAGGGITTFAEPDYQSKTGIVSDWLAGGNRTVPDVSALGDPNTGYIIGLTQTNPNGSTQYGEFREGGTSLACPLFAGLMSLVSQKQGKEAGLANPTLYGMVGGPGIRDVKPTTGFYAETRTDYVNGFDAGGGTITSIREMGAAVSTAVNIASGYDTTTGIGAPNGADFLSLTPGSGGGGGGGTGSAGTTYYFHGSPQDTTNRVNGAPSATWDTTAPTGSTDQTQSATVADDSGATGLTPAAPQDIYWMGSYADGPVSGDLHIEWWWSSDPSAQAFGPAVNVAVYTNVDVAAGTGTLLNVSGAPDLVGISTGVGTPVENISDIAISGTVVKNLLIEVAPQYINAAPVATVHYDSTTAPSQFTLPWGPATDLPEAANAATLAVGGGGMAVIGLAVALRRRRRGALSLL